VREADGQAGTPESPRDFELLTIAGEFIHAKRFDYAVIAVQTAVEIYVEQRLAMILEWRNLGPLGEVITRTLLRPPYNLRDDRSRTLWTSLTRDEIQRHEWWQRYTKHVDRRNAVVHRGKHVSEDEASESFQAAFALMSHVNHTTIATGVRLGTLAEVGTPYRADPDPY
jgi:hypothetical protein